MSMPSPVDNKVVASAAPPAKTLSKGEATAERIVDAAYALFLEQGYHGTSMRQIAERAEMTLGGIYNHFPNKEAIWVAVFTIKHPYHELAPAIRAAEGATVSEFIQRAAFTLVETLGHREDLLNLMFIELVEFKGKHTPDIYRAVLPDMLALGELFNSKQGALRAIPKPILIRSFLGLFFSYYITELLLPAEVRPLMGPDSLDAFVDIYLHGIMDPYSEPTDG